MGTCCLSLMSKKDWHIGEAKQRFSEMIRDAAEEPQLIYNRDRLVAAVVSVSSSDDVSRLSSGARGRSISEQFAELRAIATEEGYSLIVPPRRDRKNAFAETRD